MKQLTQEEIKSIELDSLAVFKNYCEQHNLKYFLMFGSLLGAVRHNGFIPWDDDVDIMMSRKDYEYLINNFNKDNIPNKKIVNKLNTEDFEFYASKLIDTTTYCYEYTSSSTGVWLDIFPYDNLPNDEKKLNRFTKRIYKKNKKLNILGSIAGAKPRKLYKRIVARILKLFINKNYVNHYYLKLNTFRQKFRDLKNAKYVGFLYKNFPIYGVPVIPSNLIKDLKNHKFENLELTIPNQYNEVLKLCYGDYNILPSKEKQISNHKYKMYTRVNEETAIILAAGKGIRISELTNDTPKPLLKVFGKPLIEYMIESLIFRGVNDIRVVVGYKKESFNYLLGKYKNIKITLIENDNFEKYGNLYSCYVAIRDINDKNVFVIEGDQYISNKDLLLGDFDCSTCFGSFSKSKSETMGYINKGFSKKIIGIKRYSKRSYLENGITYVGAYDLDELKNSIQNLVSNIDEHPYIFWDEALIKTLDKCLYKVRTTKHRDIIEIDTLKDLKSISK